MLQHSSGILFVGPHRGTMLPPNNSWNLRKCNIYLIHSNPHINLHKCNLTKMNKTTYLYAKAYTSKHELHTKLIWKPHQYHISHIPVFTNSLPPIQTMVIFPFVWLVMFTVCWCTPYKFVHWPKSTWCTSILTWGRVCCRTK